MSDGHVLIAGASGVIGQAAIAEFASRGWRVTALSRRRPQGSGFRHLALDLTDAAACAEAIQGIDPVSHVVYAALFEEPDLVSGWRSPAQMDTNLVMLRNLLEPLLDRGDHPHVSLFQGTKAYGVHIRPFAVPARESWPRHDHANFYWLHEDFLREKAGSGRLSFTIFRPQVVFGQATGVAMNLMPVIGAWAALRAAEGSPFGFPGGPPYILEAVDAALIARALVWAAVAPEASGEIFNIANGDVFVWHNVWPVIADALGLSPGVDERIVLASEMPKRAALWRRVAERFGLAEPSLDALVGRSHHYADFTFATHAKREPAPVIVSTIKLRQAGFGDCVDTEEMFRTQIVALQEQRILPSRDDLAALVAAS